MTQPLHAWSVCEVAESVRSGYDHAARGAGSVPGPISAWPSAGWCADAMTWRRSAGPSSTMPLGWVRLFLGLPSELLAQAAA